MIALYPVSQFTDASLVYLLKLSFPFISPLTAILISQVVVLRKAPAYTVGLQYSLQFLNIKFKCDYFDKNTFSAALSLATCNLWVTPVFYLRLRSVFIFAAYITHTEQLPYKSLTWYIQPQQLAGQVIMSHCPLVVGCLARSFCLKIKGRRGV